MNEPCDPTCPVGGRTDIEVTCTTTCTTGMRGYPSHQAAWRMLTRRGASIRHPVAVTYQCGQCRQIHIRPGAKFRNPSKPRIYLRNQLRRELRAELLYALRWYVTTDTCRLPVAVRVSLGGPIAVARTGTL